MRKLGCGQAAVLFELCYADACPNPAPLFGLPMKAEFVIALSAAVFLPGCATIDAIVNIEEPAYTVIKQAMTAFVPLPVIFLAPTPAKEHHRVKKFP